MSTYHIETDKGIFEVEVEDQPSSAKNSLLNTAAQGISQSPIGMVSSGAMAMQKGLEAAQHGLDVAGEKVATGLASRGVPPWLSATAGMVPSFLPDIAMASTPLGGSAKVSEAAVGPMTRALGFSKRFRMLPEAREAAREAARVTLEEKAMPTLGNPYKAYENLSQVQRKSGKALESMRKVEPKNLKPVFDSLETLRNKLTQGGATGGEWDDVHRLIDSTKETLDGLSFVSDVDLNKVEVVKKRITDSINYLTKNATQADAKKVANSIEKGIEDILRSSGIDMKKYAELKRTYGGSSNAMKALNNELAAQEGNMLPSLPSLIMSAPQMMVDPRGALGTLGFWELLKRRGSGMASNLINRTVTARGYPQLATEMGLLGIRKKKE